MAPISNRLCALLSPAFASILAFLREVMAARAASAINCNGSAASSGQAIRITPLPTSVADEPGGSSIDASGILLFSFAYPFYRALIFIGGVMLLLFAKPIYEGRAWTYPASLLATAFPSAGLAAPAAAEAFRTPRLA
jgi:hypothetical protein